MKEKNLGNETLPPPSQFTIRGLHTPEPWNYGYRRQGVCEVLEIGSEHCPIGFLFALDNQPALANAERIVSCVNALAGVQNPAAIPQLIEAVRAINTSSYNTAPPDYSWSECCDCGREEGHDDDCTVLNLIRALSALDSPQDS